MIPVEEAVDIARSACEVVEQSGLTKDYVVDAPLNNLGMKRMSALHFAEIVLRQKIKQDYPKDPVSKAPIVVPMKLSEEGYLSWLLVAKHFVGIAYDRRRLLKDSVHRGPNPPAGDLQIARAIFHELGHVFMTPELFTKSVKSKRKIPICTPMADPKQEERAWVWAMFALGVQMGHHASTNAPGIDDTVAANV